MGLYRNCFAANSHSRSAAVIVEAAQITRAVEPWIGGRSSIPGLEFLVGFLRFPQNFFPFFLERLHVELGNQKSERFFQRNGPRRQVKFRKNAAVNVQMRVIVLRGGSRMPMVSE